jgi:hypothetical protein
MIDDPDRPVSSGSPGDDPVKDAATTPIERAARGAADRLAAWGAIVKDLGAVTAAEIGVWRGEFAAHMLRCCPAIRTYYLLDAWRHLGQWNKPFNVSDEQFDGVMAEALDRTAFAAERRRILRGTTLEVAGALPDRGLDFCYIDGDHTLRGILIDLIRLYPKVRDGGILGGDDFMPSAWQHDPRFEPTLVFPTAVHFAEATGSVIYGLPHGQFAIIVDRARGDFEFRDPTGAYADRTIQAVLRSRRAGPVRRALRRLRAMVTG